MSSIPGTRPPDTEEIVQFPDPRPCDLDMSTYYHLHFLGYPPSLSSHFGNQDTTIVASELAAGLRPTESYEGILFPDLLIAFDVDLAAYVARNGYLIPEQGKPPDFVLEVSSKRTARRDENAKRKAYADMGVLEYWRFDPTGGRQYRAPLAGDRLTDGIYLPIGITRTDEQHHWGYSDALNLALCWEEEQLRFWDPAARRYLSTFLESEARAAAESARADEAEARVRLLEEELRRRQTP